MKPVATRVEAISPELVASLLRPEEQGFPLEREKGKVPRSYRAAALAGIAVACLNAAGNAAFAASATRELGEMSLGAASVPAVVALLIAALWSGARTSVVCLLVTHRLLAAIGRQSHFFYMIGGGLAAVALAAAAQVFGPALTAKDFAMEAFSGVVAGFFYRVFAGTQQPR